MTRRPFLVARADFGPGIGAGHLARCLALTARWQRVGGDAAIVSGALNDPWATRLERAGVPWHPVDAVPSDGDWYVADGYRLTDRDRQDLVRRGRLLVIDDFAETATAQGDLILDQNAGSSADDYRGRPALLGCRYVLLSDEIAELPARPTRDVVEHVVVGLGGFPGDDVRAFAAELLRRWTPSADVTVLDGRQPVRDVLLTSDLAVAAAGTFCWELCRAGVPMALFAVNRNQRRLAEGVVEAGAAVSLGEPVLANVDHAVTTLTRLVEDHAGRQALWSAARSLVDGRGASRVVARLRADLLDLRPVTAADAVLLFEWANDPDTRAASFDSRPIEWDEHLAWLDARLRSSRTSQWIGEWNRDAVGLVRFDHGDDGVAEIGVTIAPARRGSGWAAPLIAAGTARAFATGSTTGVLARVKPGNVASLRAFEAADFDPRTPDGAPVIELMRRYGGA